RTSPTALAPTRPWSRFEVGKRTTTEAEVVGGTLRGADGTAPAVAAIRAAQAATGRRRGGAARPSMRDLEKERELGESGPRQSHSRRGPHRGRRWGETGLGRVAKPEKGDEVPGGP